MKKRDTRTLWRKIYDQFIPMGAGIAFFALALHAESRILIAVYGLIGVFILIYTLQRDDL